MSNWGNDDSAVHSAPRTHTEFKAEFLATTRIWLKENLWKQESEIPPDQKKDNDIKLADFPLDFLVVHPNHTQIFTKKMDQTAFFISQPCNGISDGIGEEIWGTP